ncbi:sodium:calcium antiporter [Halobaculum sp. MBLA0147]|uniref:sodium:calcium antiporter n=1 Tax=Halobaculum sp. MBLA0147 TaxID=3079934 RepID=UPI003524D1E8
MASLLVASGLALVGTVIVWLAGGRLEESSAALGRYYGLPQVVQGAVIAAIGSSFPELSSSVLAVVRHGSFDLGVGAVVGSAIFNILVIPGIAALSGRGLDADRDVVYKEAQFYMLSVAVVLLVFSFGLIYYPGGTGAGGVGLATITPGLALIPVGLYAVYVFIQWQDVGDANVERDTQVSAGRAWLVLAGSLIAILLGVEALVVAAEDFGEIFDTPSFFWGLTVIAAGTSLPDTVVSVRAAEAGRGPTSLANVLGSNVFDLLIAIPAGVILAGGTVVSYGAAVPMMAMLTVATLLFLLVTRTDLVLTTREGGLLLGAYAAFLGWVLAEALDVTALIPGV